MTRIIACMILSTTVFCAFSAAAVTEYFPLQKANIAPHNTASLQRGAKYFVNYCLSCHSAKYSRYNRVGTDLDIPQEYVEKYLIFTEQKVGDLMTVSMTDEEGLQWFGAVPPDLTLVARSRSPDWIYTYLKSFYVDETRPMGVNNALFQNVAMPHVLWELQGWQKPVYRTITHADGTHATKVVGFERLTPGTLTAEEYDRMLLDLVAFMAYLSEPIANQRKAMGIWVLLFLFILLGLTYALKREFWKDVR